MICPQRDFPPDFDEVTQISERRRGFVRRLVNAIRDRVSSALTCSDCHERLTRCLCGGPS